MQRWCWRFLTQLQSEPTDCSSVCSGTKFTEREENIWQRPLTPVCHTEDRRISLCFFQLWASLPKTCCVNMSDCFLWASCFKTFFGCLWMSFQSVRRWCYSNKYMYVFYQLPCIKTIRKQQFERLQWTESVLWDGVWSWHSFSLPLASFLPNDSVLVAMHDTELSCALIG